MLRPWLLLTCACAAATALGYVIVATTPAVDGALAQTFAAGAILTMLASTMFPEAYRQGGRCLSRRRGSGA